MELRIGLAEFDDHDQVLDAIAAATPEAHEAKQRYLDDLFADTRQAAAIA